MSGRPLSNRVPVRVTGIDTVGTTRAAPFELSGDASNRGWGACKPEAELAHVCRLAASGGGMVSYARFPVPRCHIMNSTTMFVLLCAAALLVGALIPIQAATNAALSKSLESVFYASLILFLVGLVFVAVFLTIRGEAPPPAAAFQMAPGYGYLGGFIVATYVISITYLAPRIGVGNAICFIVTGQILSAVIIDHFGLFGAVIHDLNWRRISGVVLMIAGLFLAHRV